MSLDLFNGVRRFARSKSALSAASAEDVSSRHAPVVVMTAQDRRGSWAALGADQDDDASAPVTVEPHRQQPDPLPRAALGESIANVLAGAPKYARRSMRAERMPQERPDTQIVPASRSVDEMPERFDPQIDSADETGNLATISLIVSAASNEPVGAAALTLGRQLVRDGRALLLNLERSEQSAGPGLSDLLNGAATFTQVIRRDEGSRLHCIELGQGAVALGEAFDLVVEALAQTYSFIIINGGAADGPVSDALAPRCDVAILSGSQTVRAGRLELLRDRLRTAGAPDVMDMPLDESDREAA